jgi:hypothetical protein
MCKPQGASSSSSEGVRVNLISHSAMAIQEGGDSYGTVAFLIYAVSAASHALNRTHLKLCSTKQGTITLDIALSMYV